MLNLKTAARGQNENKKREIRFALIPNAFVPESCEYRIQAGLLACSNQRRLPDKRSVTLMPQVYR